MKTKTQKSETKSLIKSETTRVNKNRVANRRPQTNAKALEGQLTSKEVRTTVRVDFSKAFALANNADIANCIYAQLLKQLNDAHSSALAELGDITIDLDVEVETLTKVKSETTKKQKSDKKTSKKSYDATKGTEQTDLSDTKALKTLGLKLSKVEGWSDAVALTGNTRAIYDYLKSKDLRWNGKQKCWQIPTASEDYDQICKDLHLRKVKVS